MVVLIYFPAKLSFECSIGSSRLQPPQALADLLLFVTIKCRLMYLCVSDLLWLNHSDTNYLHWSFIQFINVTLYWGNLGWACELAGETVICCFKTSSFHLCYLWWGLVKISCLVQSSRPLAQHWPGLPPSAKCSPELCLCLPVGSMKFNEQRKLPEEWKIPLSHGHSYQQKPDGAPPWLHYLCEIAFSPRKPMDLPPPSWHIQRNDQYQDENSPRSLLF